MLRKKGTYLLIFRLLKEKKGLRIGSLGLHDLDAGIYVYVGSAHGPGGVFSRICRHLRKEKKRKWHIDYLTTLNDCEILGAIIFHATERLECKIAEKLIDSGFRYPIRKFGSTDCKCPAHLFVIDDLERLIHVFDVGNIRFSFYTVKELNQICSQIASKFLRLS